MVTICQIATELKKRKTYLFDGVASLGLATPGPVFGTLYTLNSTWREYGTLSGVATEHPRIAEME
jgi:hypothetical protein